MIGSPSPASPTRRTSTSSALAWLVERYQVKTDKASGIVNDVNDWVSNAEPRYIIDLVKRIVTVSVESMCIVRGLPELREAD